MSAQDRFPSLTETDVAGLLGLSRRTVQGWRLTGRGPAFHKIGGCVRYAPAEVMRFVEASTRRSTSDTGPEA